MIAKLIHLAGRIPGVGATLRRLARRYDDGTVTRIRSGVAQGAAWRRWKKYASGYWLGNYEIDVQIAFSRNIRPGMVVFDVGANAGFFSVIAGKCCFPAGKVVAIDPDPDNLTSLNAQAELNPEFHIHIEHCAVSSSDGVAQLFRQSPGASGASLLAESDATSSVTVETVTLDRLASKYGVPDFIKLDVENHELAAVQGAAEILRQRKAIWLIEYAKPNVKEILAAAGLRFTTLTGDPVASDAPELHHILALPG